MSESKRSPVKRKLIFGSVVAVAMVLVLSAVGIYVSFDLPATVDLALFSEDDAGPSRSAARRGDSPGLANSDAGQPQSIPVAQPPSAEAGVRMVDIIVFPRIVSFDNIGESQQLTVQGFYSDGSVGELVNLEDLQPSFSSSEPGAVQVNSDGLVTSLEMGGSDILVRYGEHATEVPVLVWGPVRHIPAPDLSKLVDVSDDGTAVLVNRVLVDLEPGYGDADAAELAAMINGQVIFQYLSFPGYILEFESSGMADLEGALTVLHDDGRVAAASPDHTISVSEGPPPTNTPLPDAQGFKEARIPEAWAFLNQNERERAKTPYLGSYYSEPVVIVVIDDYFPPKSTSLGTVKAINKYGDVFGLGDVFDYEHIKVIDNESDSAPPQQRLHGVQVTSILVAQPEAINNPALKKAGMRGVVTGVDGLPYILKFYGIQRRGKDNSDMDSSLTLDKLGSLRDENPESLTDHGLVLDSDTTNALDYLSPQRDRVAVVNMSFSKPCSPDCGEQDRWSTIMSDMKETTFVVAAGNCDLRVEGVEVDKKCNKREIKQDNIVIPASLTVKRGERDAVTNVITVGGLDGVDKHVSSSYGDAITIAAPYRVRWLSLEPAQDGKEWYADYKEWPAGTSYSAPLVTGTVALMKATFPSRTPEQIIAILKATGADTNWCRPSVTVTPCPPDESIKLLNAEAAVKKNLEEVPTYVDPTERAKLGAAIAAMTPSPGPTTTPPTSCPTPRYSGQGDLPVVKLPASKGAFMVRHTLVGDQTGKPEWFLKVDQWPTPLEEIKERTPNLFWGFVVDLGCEAEDFEFHGYTWWRNITDPVRPSAWSVGDPVLLKREAGGSGLTFFYEIRWWGNMSPGTYQFQLVDERGNDVFSWDFRVVENAGLSLDQYRSRLPNIQLPNIAAPLISHGLEPTFYNTLDFSLDWRVVTKMVGADLLILTWLLEFDTTEAPMNLPFAAVVRWVDVTDPDRPVVLSGAGQDYQGTGFGRSYYRASRGTGELGYWKPGRYQVRLIDRNSGEILAYLSFEVN